MVINEHIFQDFKAGTIDSLYAGCYSSLIAYAARTLTDNYALMAEDCVQDAILTTYHHRDEFQSLLHFKSFLFTCIHNKCISILRKAASSENYRKEQSVMEESVMASIVEQETIDLLQTAIAHLPKIYREVFELSYEQGLSNAEAAKMLGLSIDGMKKRKSKLIALLREKFRDRADMQLLLTLLIGLN
ncbi:MAG: RNA polymerase sigma factor [Prevotella sp.]|jgi:RNA polymerase sigma factor (sigma-70 family)